MHPLCKLLSRVPRSRTPAPEPLCSHTFSANCPQRVHVMSVDELLLEHHLDGDDDLGHDDQQVPCGEGSQGDAGLQGVGVEMEHIHRVPGTVVGPVLGWMAPAGT